SLEVVKRIGTNIIENNVEVRRVVDEFTKDWPETVKVTYMIDQSSFIFEVLGSLQSSIITAIALVMIIVVASLGVGSGLLVGIAIPTSFMVGFLILSAAGLTVNMMVMFGMVLCVGMLVDGAIVVTEYANRKMSEGMPPNEAYPRAAKLMFWPVVSSTATTLAAFLPLLLWPGVPGEFMSYLPIMVIIVLTASLMTALIFLPSTGVVFATIGGFLGRYQRIIKSTLVGVGLAMIGYFGVFSGLQASNVVPASAAIQTLLAIGLGALGALATWYITGWLARRKAAQPKEEDSVARMLSSKEPLNVWRVPGAMGAYLKFLSLAAGSLVGNIIVIAMVIGTAVLTFTAFGENSKGVEFFVDEEPDIALMFVSARGNLSGSDIRDLAVRVEQEVLKVKGIENVVMNATAPGGGGGNAPNPSLPQDLPADNVATLTLELSDYSERRRAREIFAEARERTASIPGIKVELRKIEGGPPTGKDIRLQVKSTNYDTLIETVTRIRGKFDTLEDIQDLEDGRPLPGIDWKLTVDREEAGRYNASIPAVGAMIQLITNGALIGTANPDDSDDQIDIRVRLPEEERSLDKLSEFKLRTANGQVPISNFVDMQPKPRVSSITRRDGLYAMDVKANLLASAKADGLTPDEKIGEIQAWLDTQEWPENIFIKFRGADEEQKESGEFLGKAAMGALFLMFIILLTQFNSFYQTIITLMTVILAIIGVLIGMMITGQKFSIIMTGTGVVALAGIVVNNAIVLIDTYNRLRSEGIDVRDAMLKTSGQRLRPILLTTITTIMGLVPMAMETNLNFFTQTITIGSITAIWWTQLATAIISGLAFSTLLTLIVIPSALALPTNVVRSGKWIASPITRRMQPALTTDAAQELPPVDQQEVVPAVVNEPIVEAPVIDPDEAEEVAAEQKPVRKPVAKSIPKQRKVRVKKATSKRTASAKEGSGKPKTPPIADAAE
ncbi:MAG: efflux RND transporter permease subunit, partial [Rhizobiaceae bacterium]|nr:efflux RND transporter permease subunit [Rhizobiaceae bacterium]